MGLEVYRLNLHIGWYARSTTHLTYTRPVHPKFFDVQFYAHVLPPADYLRLRDADWSLAGKLAKV
jgi:hypothetical protein